MFTQKRTWISLGFIGVTFYFLFRNTDKAKLLEVFAQFHLPWLLPALAVYLLGYVIRGYRWVILLSPVKKCSFQSLFPTLMIGFMANNVLPARAGEFVRAHLNGKKEGISRSSSFATIVLERLFDGLTMMILLWAALLFGQLPVSEDIMPAGIRHAIHWAPYVFGFAFLLLLALLLFKQTAVQTLKLFVTLAPERFHGPFERLLHTFIDGLQILQNVRESLVVLLASLAAWTCEFSAYFLLAAGIGIAPSPLTLWSSALLMAIVNLAILIPNAPGGIGLFEFIGVALLLPFKISKEMAVGYMFLVHFLVLIPITLLGFYYTHKEHLSLKGLESSRSSEKGTPS